jgi:tetratricopeptide (TPR) repeat protein
MWLHRVETLLFGATCARWRPFQHLLHLSAGEFMDQVDRFSFERLQSFREGLKFLRKRVRLTQGELARAVGYSREQITHLESGRRKPNPTTIAALFIPALNLRDQPELVAHLLRLAEAAQIDSAPGVPRPEAHQQVDSHPAEAEEERAVHRLAAETAELAQGDLVEAAREYYLARDFKAAADVLLDQGQLLSNQGRAPEAVVVLDQILADLSEQDDLRDQPDIMRRLLTTRGDLLLNTARAEEAEANYREALAFASGAVQTTLIYRLAGSLTQRGRAAEALAMVQEAYTDLPPQHVLIRAQLKIVESGALMALSRFEEAQSANLEALALADQIALAMPFIVAGIRARAHNALGAVNAIHHRPSVALEHWKQAVDTARLAGQRSLEYRCQGNIANLLYEMGDLVGAMTACEAAIDGLRSIDDLHGMSRFLHLRANLLYIRGDIAASLNMAEEACNVKRQLGDHRSLLVSLGQQIKSLFALGRLDEAMPMLDHGLAGLDDLGDDRLRGYWLILVSEWSMLSGEYERARDVVHAALELPTTAQELKLQGDCCNHLAVAILAAGDVDGALNTLAYERTEIPEIEFERELIVGLLHLARGDDAAAARCANSIVDRAQEQGYLIFALRAKRLLDALSDPLLYRTFPALLYGKVTS